MTGVPAADLRAAARLYAAGTELRDLLRPRRHRAQPGLDDGHGHGQPRDGHRQRRARRRRREPAARAEQRAGLVRHGLVPARAARLPARLRPRRPGHLRGAVGHARSRPSRACASPTCSTPRSRGRTAAMFVQGEDLAQSDPNQAHVKAALSALDLLVVQDLFLNETAAFAHVFLPGTSFLEKDGTFTNAERRINRVRPVMAPRTGKQEWEVACELATAMGYPMRYANGAEIMDEIAATTPTFAGVSFAHLDEVGSHPVAVQRQGPRRHADHARRHVRARQGALRRDARSCPPTSAPAASTRSSSRPAGSCRSTTSARRPGAPRTCSGTRRTCWRSTRTTPRTAGSPRARRCGSRAGSARRCCTHGSASG